MKPIIVRGCRGTFLCLVLGFSLASCASFGGDGPLLVHTSGAAVHVVIHSSDGSRVEDTLNDQSAVWAGSRRTHVERVEIEVAGSRFVLEGEHLQSRYGKDPSTAFIIEAEGPRKLTMDEARILMRRR